MVAVDLCNLALSYLGDTATVASIDPPEGSAQAQHCARFYPIALNTMLEMHQWNFCTTRITLAQLASVPSSGYCYAYAMPTTATDIISVLPTYTYATYPGLSFGGEWQWRPWPFEYEALRDFKVEQAGSTQVILSNAYEAIARYTTSTVQPGQFPALFADALAWRLAAMLAGPLLKGDVGAAESKRCMQMFAAIAGQAVMQDSNQQHDERRSVPVWIRDR